MPQEPKKRHSRQRKGKRRASIKLLSPRGVFCQNCQNAITPHTICKKCGFYKGKQIYKLKQKTKEKNYENTPGSPA